MARTPLGHKDTTYGGDPGSAGYQGSTGAKLGTAIGGAGAAAVGLGAGVLTGGLVTGVAAIAGLIGLVGDMIASGSGARKPKAAKVKPQMVQREPSRATGGAGSAGDPGSSVAPGFGPDVRLQAAQNLGRRFG